MIKDQQYWKDYNQKRKEYNRLKQQEYRKRIKVADNPKVADSQLKDKVADKVADNSASWSVADRIKVADAAPLVADSQSKEQVADRPKEKVADTTQPKLWSDYYNCQKPFCSGCIKKGISADQYAFCSLAKATDPDFPNLYFCQVFHWTVYQGQKSRSLVGDLK